MSQTPPPVDEGHFLAVDTTNRAEVTRRFEEFVESLHSYLNQLPCLRDLQQARRQWTRPRERDAFGSFAAGPRYWYTFNHGGRNEAQLNIGLCAEQTSVGMPAYLRVGLGFEFTERVYGEPETVKRAYACFQEVVRAMRGEFKRFVAHNQLEIEWSDHTNYDLGHIIPTSAVVAWLRNPPQEVAWIFVGRLLRRDKDASVLEDPHALGQVMREVLCGFRPIWERTQVMAHKP